MMLMIVYMSIEEAFAHLEMKTISIFTQCIQLQVMRPSLFFSLWPAIKEIDYELIKIFQDTIWTSIIYSY